MGIDVTTTGTEAGVICRLGLEPIPLASDSVDLVTANDVLEPKICTATTNGEVTYIYPTIPTY